MKNRFLDKLVCPSCSAKGDAALLPQAGPQEGNALRCPLCKTVYQTDRGIIDFVGDRPRIISHSQSAMEFSPIVAVYERIWRPLITIPFSDLSWEMKTAYELLDLKSDHDLLDIACGTGNFTRLFAETVSSGTIIGADLSMPMLVKALKERKKTGHSNISFMRVDVTRWPFIPQGFDRINCAGGLHLFLEIQSVFEAVFRSLKPGGIFVGATYVKGKGSIPRSMQDLFSAHSGFHWFTPEELFGLARQAGFIGWEQQIKKQGILFRVRKKAS
jgi:ubiquinone/menaquinone biosynthesis C-methylase UbiE/uncharacterized protein YbaR (Trm112 family)